MNILFTQDKIKLKREDHEKPTLYTKQEYLEEVLEVEDGERALVLDVEQPEEVLQRLRLLLVLDGEHEVQIGLVVEFALVRQVLLEHAAHEHRRQRPRAVPSDEYLVRRMKRVIVINISFIGWVHSA